MPTEKRALKELAELKITDWGIGQFTCLAIAGIFALMGLDITPMFYLGMFPMMVGFFVCRNRKLFWKEFLESLE